MKSALVGRFFERTSSDPTAYLRAYEEGICKDVFEKLWGWYPGYDWKVKADASPTHGMVTVTLPSLMHQAVGYHFPIDALAGDPNRLIVRRAGGEILERWKLRRGQANATAYKERRAQKRVFSYKDAIPA